MFYLSWASLLPSLEEAFKKALISYFRIQKSPNQKYLIEAPFEEKLPALEGGLEQVVSPTPMDVFQSSWGLRLTE